MSPAATSPATLTVSPARGAARAAGISRWVHLFPGLADVAFILPALLMVRLSGLSFLLGDGDTGWHIRTGEWILRNGRVPSTDLFSYTKPNAPWFAWEWLWDVIFGWLHLHFGMPAVLLASLFLICLVSARVYQFASAASANPVIAMAVTFTGAVASSVHWLARPHLASLLFVLWFCLILEQASRGRSRRLWLLPCLTVLWANLHAGFFVGVLLIGTYAAGELCAALCAPDHVSRRAAWARCGKYLLTGCACAVSSLVNPYGYHLHVHIYQYFSEKYHFNYIDEFQSLSFHHPAAPFVWVLLMAGAAGALWHLTHRRFTWALLLLTWAWLALVAARNIPIYVICAAAPIAVASQELLESLENARVAPWLARLTGSFRRFAGEITLIETPWRAHLTGIGAFVLLAVLCCAPAPAKPFQARFNPARFPCRAVDTFFTSAPTGRIFTTDSWGGYLIYRFYPEIRVFVDGRSDFYGPRFGEQWSRILFVKNDWERQLNKFGVDTVLLPAGASLAAVLKESRNWRLVYDDGISLVFRTHGKASPQASAADTGGGGRRDRAITKTINPQTTIPTK